MTLGGYLTIFRQRWWVIALCTLLGAVVVFAVTPAEASDKPPVSSYTATATLLTSDAQASLGRIALYITTGEVPRRAAESLGFTEDPAILAEQVTVTPDEKAQAVTIAATNAEAQVAADRANAFADAAVEFFAADANASVTLLQAATPIPNYPTGGAVMPPSRALRTTLGATVGLLLGLALAIMVHRMDGRLRTREQIAQATGLPVVAEIPKLKGKDRQMGALMVNDAPLSPYADGYRSARSAISHALREVAVKADAVRGETVGHVILVTSALAGEGKTTSVANLAASFAETGQSVLVVDADLRKPDVHQLFLVPQGAGASDYLAHQDLEFNSLVRPTNVEGVGILTAGTQLEHPASLTSRMGPVAERARQSADIVLLDASPMLMASDSFDILPLVDTVLFVARSGLLTSGAAQRAAELLNRFRVPVAGMIIIGAPRDRSDGYGYGYGYGYGTAKREQAEREQAERELGKTAEAVTPAPSEPAAARAEPARRHLPG